MSILLRTHSLPASERIARILHRWNPSITQSIQKVLENSLDKDSSIDIYQALHEHITFLKAHGSSAEEIEKIVRRQIDDGFYFFFTNANLQEAKTFRGEYFETQRIVRKTIDAINLSILNEGTDTIRARSIYHLKLLWLQSNLEWIANPENNDFTEDFEKWAGKEFRDFCDDIQGLLLVISLVNKDPSKSSGPEDMSANAIATVVNSLEKLTLAIRTFWVALSTKNTGVAGRRMICAVSEFICNEARKIRVTLDETLHHESLRGTEIKEILREKKRELDYAYSVQLIILSHHENIDSPESLEHVLEKIREGEAVMCNSEIDRINEGIWPNVPNRYAARFTHAASINAAIATGIYSRVCESGETRAKNIIQQECLILSHLSQYNAKNRQSWPSEFVYSPGAANQEIFTQYCISKIEGSEHSTEKEKKLTENEKDALRILLILNQHSRSIRVTEVEKLIRAWLRQLSNIESITVMDVEILIYALENITELWGESSLETIRFLESFLANHCDRLTIAPAFSRLYLLMAVFLAKHTKLSIRSKELYVVLKHLENYRTYVNNDIEYRNQSFMLQQIKDKFYTDNEVDPQNPVAKLLWESAKEWAEHAYELETSHTISQIISPNKDITLTVTKDRLDREKKEGLQRILSRELFLGTCEILIYPITDVSWQVAIDPVRIGEETLRLLSAQTCGPTEFIRPLVVDSFLIVFRGKKASRKLFTKILEKHETNISTVIRAYSSKVVHNHLEKAQAREAELIRKELESATQDDDTKLPNLKSLQQKLSKDPGNPTSLIFIRVVSPVDLYNPEIKRKVAKGIEKRLQIGLAIRKIASTDVSLYQIDGQTFIIDITKIRAGDNTAREIIKHFLNNPITELASTQCLYGCVQQAPASLAIQQGRIALDKVVWSPQLQSYETTADDIDQFETEMRLAELIKEFTKDPRNVQPNYQAIADFSISQGDALAAKKLEVLFGMKKDCALAEFIKEHNAKIWSGERHGTRMWTEAILRIAKSCGEYPRITQLMIEAALRQMQTQEEELSVAASLGGSGSKKIELSRPENGYDFSVNISADDLLDRNFARNAIELLNKYGYTSEWSIRRVAFEIIESPLDLMNDIVVGNLLELKNHGCIFAIDDFGKEHSNHSRTTELGELLGYAGKDSKWAIAFIKVDSFFVKEIHKKKPNQASVIGMLAQAKEIWWDDFPNHVVVEWIEKTHDDELAWFVRQWVTLFQWWRFSMPSQLKCEWDKGTSCEAADCGHHPWCKIREK